MIDHSKARKMTQYDVGQDLIACADLLSEKQVDLRRDGYVEFADLLKRCALQIGDAFNYHVRKTGSHNFGLHGMSDFLELFPEKKKKKKES